ncbi:MAG: methyltransferase domain-containing protein [Ectothiorhodospiraceae bacterium]|nr:methyltransferase domain-containing protein [Ectothiorhodospiraceae bacterium]
MNEPASRGQASGTRWDAGQYLRFAGHRLRPALELLGQVPHEAPGLVYDLGCGTGDISRVMTGRWPAAEVVGLDSSPQMLTRAAAGGGNVRWEQADIAAWTPPRPPDVIYSNATLQWLGGHRALFPRLLGLLAPGGCLAVQMPLSWDQPSHRLMRETLADGAPDGGALGTPELAATVGRRWVDDAADYYDLLAPSAAALDIWETEYLQVLEGEDPVLEWVKGTGLRPILEGLEGTERARFLDLYRERLRATYPRRADGRTLYPFRRLFIVAVRA